MRVESALRSALPVNPPYLDGLFEAFDDVLAHIGELEQPHGQLVRARRHDNAVGRRERLQPRGKVGRLPDDHLLLRRVGADQFADHHQAGRDADPPAQRSVRMGRQTRQVAHDRQGRSYRALGVVLMRAGIAEIDENAVAHEFGDVPAEPFDALGAEDPVRAEELHQRLRIDES